jgi:hypothetical protein
MQDERRCHGCLQILPATRTVVAAVHVKMGPDTIPAKLYSAPFLSNPSSWLEPLSKLWIRCQEQVQVVRGRVGPAPRRERTGYPVKRLPRGARVLLHKRILHKLNAYQENLIFRWILVTNAPGSPEIRSIRFLPFTAAPPRRDHIRATCVWPAV